jgi:hypothetical protein
MKTKHDPVPESVRPTEAEIREYAHHLYIQSGWLPGRDLDNWLEAETHLRQELAEEHGHTHRREAAHAFGA